MYWEICVSSDKGQKPDASEIGEGVAEYIKKVIEAKPFPEQ